MNLFHLLSIIGTAIALTRAADYKKYAVVVISVPTPVVHDVSVFAKPSSELDPVTRWAAADVGVGCLKKYRDPVTGECPYHDYLHVTSVEFIRPTDLPRNITVKFKDYTIQVSVPRRVNTNTTVYLCVEPGDGWSSCVLESSP
jgi:hypothetical protein